MVQLVAALCARRGQCVKELPPITQAMPTLTIEAIRENPCKVYKTFTYIDSGGRRWVVPDGTVSDGASVPRVFWSIIGGPFEDKYRDASIVHDLYCVKKTRK
jgi:hypothetical protein